MDCFYEAAGKDSIQITLFTKAEFDELAKSSLENVCTWLLASNRSIKQGSHYLVPDVDGKLNQVVVIVDDNLSIWTIAGLSLVLPTGNYFLSDSISVEDRQKLTIGWGLGSYQYSKYLPIKECARLSFSSDIDQTTALAVINSTQLNS